MKWGDEDEDDEGLPQREERMDGGIKTVTEYRHNAAGQRVKTVKQIRVVESVTREPRAVAARLARLQKFGAAKHDEENVTIVSHSEERVTLEEEQVDVQSAMNDFAKKQMWRKLQQKYGVEEEEEVVEEAKHYVPPSMRGKEGAGTGTSLKTMAYDDRDHATLRVTNISEDTAEQDLQTLFSPYGDLTRIYLAKDRETMVSRGFAFVSYHNRNHAARAMAALQGHGYDHLILKIEWAKPSTRDPSTEGGLSSGFTSGYGKALAQDTKERVSYASNLTQNR